jgi:hypothetical protein
MDGDRFDGIVRAWGSGSRRHALRVVGGGLLGIAGLAGPGLAAAQPRKHHHHHHKCTDLLSSAKNCGVCGHACPADHPTCSHGNCCNGSDCICSPAGFACDGETLCENSGVNCNAGGCLPSGVCP